MAPDETPYKTDVVADLDTAFRRWLRFSLRIWLIVVGVVVAIGVVVGLAVWKQVSDNNREKNAPTEMPNLVGLDNVGAARALSRAGLDSRYDRIDKADAAAGFNRVIGTDPPAGARVERDAAIRVTFSCGPPRPPFCNP